ncbi:hypothetical protein QYE76_051111 [Lolium multiflorum]|uniref:Uncharacterized protein n=1 Tax=Lolium multiflorum TaxID=4521 RepID=A0AAD8SR90_LOLMU|nr:hypothetical protein QYE76_051111 [Lolium multiflorum]
MPILLSASTCTVESEQGEHLFKILDHSLHRGMGVGHYIQSSCFAVGGHDWCIRYYPDGRDGPTEDNKDAITLALELVEMDPNEDLARVSCTISIFDWMTKRFSSLLAFTERFSNSDCLVSRTIDRATVEASDYVVDDRLTLKCTMTVIKDPYVMEDHIEVPPSNITEQLGKLLDAKDGADVIFEVQGEELPAHKLVLAMRSPVFKALLYGSMKEKDSNRVIIDDMQPAIFKVLLHFIYTDSLPPKMDDDLEGDDKKEVTRHLLVAADRYAMERLKLMSCDAITLTSYCSGMRRQEAHASRTALPEPGRPPAATAGPATSPSCRRSQPPNTVNGSLLVTVQARSSTSRSAREENLCFRTHAAEVHGGDAGARHEPAGVAQARVARAARRHGHGRHREEYRSIVFQEPRFVEYFRSATPETEYGRMNIGSRPSKRWHAEHGMIL